MDGAQDSSTQNAARWYARLRALDCTPDERSEFEAWRAGGVRNAAAYSAAERINDALAALTKIDSRLKAMVKQAAIAGTTLPDDVSDERSVASGSPRYDNGHCGAPSSPCLTAFRVGNSRDRGRLQR